MKPLSDDERKLAEAAARLIATAAKIGLPDAPDKLVSPDAIRFLAQAYLDLHARVEQLSSVIGDLEQLAALRKALADQLRSIQGHVDQIAKTAVEAVLREEDEGLKKKWQGLLATISSAGRFVDTMPGARRRVFPKPKLVPDAAPAPKSAAPADGLVGLYCRVMHEAQDFFAKHDSFIVRVWDGMDGCWTDCVGPVPRDEALRVWAERTNGGTRQISYAEIDYYRIFPGGTRMTWDGSEGKEMFR